MEPVNLAQKLALFTKHWHPHVIAEGENLLVFVAKLQDDFVMHAHDNSDEFFYVVKGEIEMRFADHAVRVKQGEIILVPRGIEHCPRTNPGEEAQVMLVELRGTAHTGNVQSERTVKEYPRI